MKADLRKLFATLIRRNHIATYDRPNKRATFYPIKKKKRDMTDKCEEKKRKNNER